MNFWSLRSFALLFFNLHHITLGDLPIHAVTNDLVGWWEFQLGHLGDVPDTCGSGIPNTNLENLSEDTSDWLDTHRGGARRKTILYLSGIPIPLEKTQFIVSNNTSITPAESHSFFAKSMALFPETRKSWLVLPVYARTTGNPPSKTLMGYWTMTFDQGLEVSLIEYPSLENDDKHTYAGIPNVGNTTRLMAYMKYAVASNEKCKPKNGDGESQNGDTPCYETDPGSTMVGWQNFVAGHNEVQKWGCWQGRKVNSEGGSGQQFMRMRGVRATVREVKSADAQSHGMHKYSKTSYLTPKQSGFWSDFPAASFIQSQSKAGNQSGLYACSKSSESAESRGIRESLPKAFSWGDPFTNATFRPIKDEILINQGDCGSCYAVSAAYVLQKRSEILLRRLVEDKDWSELFADGDRLSPLSVISCSYYNQGCDGGLPYLVGKWAQDFGIANMKCMDFTSRTVEQCRMSDVVEVFNKTHTSAPSPHTSDPSPHTSAPSPHTSDLSPKPHKGKRRQSGAKDEGSRRGEGSRRAGVLSPISIINNSGVTDTSLDAEEGNRGDGQCDVESRVYARKYGYVGGCYECCSEASMMNEIYNHGPVAVALDAPTEMFYYRDGIFDHLPTWHSKICDNPQQGLNGWEFTTHAVVIVGWGEDSPKNGESVPQKYWIVRNSWGDTWGQDGYMKLIRGRNLGGIEAQAIYLDPDPTRGKLLALLEKFAVPNPHIESYLQLYG